MAELLDGVAVKNSKNIKAGDHLVIIEGFGCPLAEEENMLEHANGSRSDFFLNNWFSRDFVGSSSPEGLVSLLESMPCLCRA